MERILRGAIKLFKGIFNSEKGGGQGNALTGLFYVINQNSALKETEARLPWIRAQGWRDAVTNRPTEFHTTEINLAADEFLSDNPHRGGYHGMHVPGA